MQEKLSKRNKEKEILSKTNIGLRFKAVRFEKGFSQADMAALLSLSRSNYSQIELGKQYPTFETMVNFAKYFNKSYDWILHGEKTEELLDLNTLHCLEKNTTTVVFPAPLTPNGKTIKITIDEYDNYIKNSADINYINELTSFNVLGQAISSSTSQYRAFEVAEKNYSLGLSEGDFIIAEPVLSLAEMIFGNIYVTVCNNEINIIEIVDFVDGEAFVCRSKHAANKFIQLSSLKEIWISTAIYSVRSRAFLDDLVLQVNKLDAILKNMKNEMAQLKSILNF
jgi:transcriptional regulator with XRE-family HTH domain